MSSFKNFDTTLLIIQLEWATAPEDLPHGALELLEALVIRRRVPKSLAVKAQLLSMNDRERLRKYTNKNPNGQVHRTVQNTNHSPPQKSLQFGSVL